MRGFLDLESEDGFVPTARQGLLGVPGDEADLPEAASGGQGFDLLGGVLAQPRVTHLPALLRWDDMAAPTMPAYGQAVRFAGDQQGDGDEDASASTNIAVEGGGSSAGAPERADAPKQAGDFLNGDAIKKKIFPNLEHGDLPAEDVKAIVLHRLHGKFDPRGLQAPAGRGALPG